MQKWWMKACPKCQGDLFEVNLLGDWEISCLQCGYVAPRDLAQGLRTRPTSVRPLAGASTVKVSRAA